MLEEEDRSISSPSQGDQDVLPTHVMITTNVNSENHTMGVLENLTFLNNTDPSNISCDPFGGNENLLPIVRYQGIIFFMYSTVFVVALTGNSLVCYVVYINSNMRKVTHFFFVNLALSDILISIFCVPTSSVTMVLQRWAFGDALCPTVNYFQAVSILVSAYTLVAISINRYIAIRWPLRPRQSNSQAKLLLLAVWVFALTIAFPVVVVSKLTQPYDRHKVCHQYECQEIWPLEDNRRIYSIALLILQYLIPIIILVFTYTSIAVMVWGKRPPGEAEGHRDQSREKSKRKMVKMLMTVVIVFTMCWLPFNVLVRAIVPPGVFGDHCLNNRWVLWALLLFLIVDHYESVIYWSGLPFLWLCLHWLAMSHSCYNPVIYCWMSANFRAGFVVAISRIPGIRRFFRNEIRDNNTSVAGMPLAGFNGSGHSALQRRDTCTTYVSVRRKVNGSQNATGRNGEPLRRCGTQQSQRDFECPDSHSEEQL